MSSIHNLPRFRALDLAVGTNASAAATKSASPVEALTLAGTRGPRPLPRSSATVALTDADGVRGPDGVPEGWLDPISAQIIEAPVSIAVAGSKEPEVYDEGSLRAWVANARITHRRQTIDYEANVQARAFGLTDVVAPDPGDFLPRSIFSRQPLALRCGFTQALATQPVAGLAGRISTFLATDPQVWGALTDDQRQAIIAAQKLLDVPRSAAVMRIINTPEKTFSFAKQFRIAAGEQFPKRRTWANALSQNRWQGAFMSGPPTGRGAFVLGSAIGADFGLVHGNRGVFILMDDFGGMQHPTNSGHYRPTAEGQNYAEQLIGTILGARTAYASPDSGEPAAAPPYNARENPAEVRAAAAAGPTGTSFTALVGAMQRQLDTPLARPQADASALFDLLELLQSENNEAFRYLDRLDEDNDSGSVD